MTIIFKVVGQGTKALAAAKRGDVFDVLMPLGNGFDITKCGSRPLLDRRRHRRASAVRTGRGHGRQPGIRPQVVTGFNGKSDIILTDEFRALGIEPVITTVDGSAGIKGFVTDAMKTLDYDYVYTCGPWSLC